MTTNESDEPSNNSGTEIGAGLFEENMGPSSALAHMYRGEIHRMKFWRERLDRTSNWAITLMAAILTWAFSSRNNPHYIVLLAIITVSIFLLIEARRYRAYDIWRSRVRMLQQNVFALALDDSKGVVDEDWRQKLSEDYRNPKMKVSLEEALAHRLRRVYAPLFCILLLAWVFQLTAYTPSAKWPQSAAIEMIPGTVVTGLVVAFYAGLFVIAYRPRTWHINGEILPSDVTGWDYSRD
ncbi:MULTISPECIES: DUF2270 domain-containing protein [unclassified Haladaptatus]|uniref:DUF2270 domain-containing protein n=1 Tax=unclassified Haladaptatus TaxID=2622732 RepID=UPI00209C141D|nr:MULTISPECIES: DUF2270 domain-containing protein [unclassified Haladaptatus]MCO8244670.1 DUF2270 domain-containing protein [Haladaptatus sp. AB643]MCO8253708.1 DUF2270 domain-containing protein [Haladaptatus sp. AB618]